MNTTATTSESTTTLLQVALMLNRELALNLGCCHAYKDNVGVKDAGLFLQMLGLNPLAVQHSDCYDIVVAVLSGKSCVESVDIVVETVNGFIIVGVLDYFLIFSNKAAKFAALGSMPKWHPLQPSVVR